MVSHNVSKEKRNDREKELKWDTVPCCPYALEPGYVGESKYRHCYLVHCKEGGVQEREGAIRERR